MGRAPSFVWGYLDKGANIIGKIIKRCGEQFLVGGAQGLSQPVDHHKLRVTLGANKKCVGGGVGHVAFRVTDVGQKDIPQFAAWRDGADVECDPVGGLNKSAFG